MRKRISILLAAVLICQLLTVIALPASAVTTKLYFRGAASPSGSITADNGGYYATSPVTFLTGADDLSVNGLTFTGASDGHCLWADYYGSVAAAGLRYLHYTIPEDNVGALYKLTVCFNALGYDASKEQPLPLTAGEHIIDLMQYTDTTDTYFYVIPGWYAGATAVLNNFYLSNSRKHDGEVPEAAANNLYFAGVAGTGMLVAQNGAYWASSTVTFLTGADDLSENGLTFGAEAAGNTIWADGYATVINAGLRYLHYTIPENTENIPVVIWIQVTGGYDVTANEELPITPGKHVIDLADYENGYPYLYLCVGWNAGQTVVLNDFRLSDKASEPPVCKSHQLLLSGQLGMNFYMDLSALSESEKAASYMAFEVNGEPQTAEFDAANVNENGYYAFTAYVNAVQMAEDIVPVFHYGEETVELEPYSVADYLAYIDAHSSDYIPETLELVHAVADYGHYAQPFLAESNGWTVGEKYTEATEYYTEEYDYAAILALVSDKGLVKDITGSAVTKVSYMLNLDSETGLDVFLTTSAEPTLNGGLTAEKVGKRYRVSFTGIKAQELGDDLVVSGNAEGAFSVTVSGLSYVRAVLKNDSFNATAKNAVCALYNYYVAAVNYLTC